MSEFAGTLSKPFIIGAMGGKGAGKDTLADYLTKELGFHRLSYAEALYKQVAEAFDVSVSFLGERATKESPSELLAMKNCMEPQFIKAMFQFFNINKSGLVSFMETPLSPRQVMQWWGTEFRRQSEFGIDDYWISIVNNKIKQMSGASIVITDVRFPNEADNIENMHNLGIIDVYTVAELWRVNRPLVDEAAAARRAAGDPAANHPSETSLLDRPAKCYITNIENDWDSVKRGAFQYFESLKVIA